MRAYALPALAGSVSAGVSVPSRVGQKQNCFWQRVSLIFQGVFSIVARGQKQMNKRWLIRAGEQGGLTSASDKQRGESKIIVSIERLQPLAGNMASRF